jgi:hypothetical protein
MTLTSGEAPYLPDGRLLNWPWCLSTWRGLSRPVVPTVTSAGRFTIFNLDIIFYPWQFEPERLKALVDWLEERSGQRMSQEEPQS